MEIKFLGATKCITGSCHLIEFKNKKILLDCGFYQGKDKSVGSNEDFPFEPSEIDAVILSHAHMDHIGKIPLLFKLGFKGEVFCTEGTKELSAILLMDSANIQEIEFKNKNNSKILYSKEDVEKSLIRFKGCDYDKEIDIIENVKLILKDAGHLLGSAICELEITEEGKKTKIVYSGDLGNLNVPIINNPDKVNHGDYVILESTYGDKIHDNKGIEIDEFIKIIKDTTKKQGNVLIPAFSLGRTQELIYILNKFIEKENNKYIKVYIDGLLASKTTEVFRKYKEYFDREAMSLLEKGDDPLDFKNLYFLDSKEESMSLKNVHSSVIIASNGFCEGGRIVHHIKNNIEDEKNSIILLGHQHEESLGYEILKGNNKISIHGEEFEVRASVHNFSILSGHGDKEVLTNWIYSFKEKPKKIFLVHGIEPVQINLKKELIQHGFDVEIPSFKQQFLLI